jgi:F-type H+-transporting ATPase subunit a
MPEVVLPEISIRAEPVFDIALPWGGHFVITNSMVYTIIVMAALALFFWWATRRMSVVPRGKQNFAEAIVEFLLGVTEGTAGRRVGRRIFPLIATLFIFIITANYAGLLPGVGTIGYCTAAHGEEAQVLRIKTAAPALAQEGEAEGGGGLPEAHCTYVDEAGVSHDDGLFIPYLRAPNADINTTLAMALLAVGVVQVAGIAAHGIGGYAKELLTPLWLAPIHIVGELSRVISLSFRLFGNIFGGEVLVTVMYVLLGSIFIGFGTFIFLGLELLFGFIQALVFSTLTLVYIATAVGGHGSNGGGHGDEAHAPAGPAEAMGHRAAALLTGRSEASGPEIEGTEPKSGTERHMG